MRGVFVSVSSLSVALLLCFLPCRAQAEQGWYLRVVARDDTPAAQAEKYQVRDAVLRACPSDPKNLAHALPAIHAAANAYAPCQAELRLWSPSPDRPSLPTLYIVIGDGAGRNWWGVLYEDALLLARADDEADSLSPTENVVFLWPWLAWLRQLLCGL